MDDTIALENTVFVGLVMYHPWLPYSQPVCTLPAFWDARGARL